MRLHGVGIGDAVVVGPVRRMPEPLPEPAPRSHDGDAAAEFAAAREALAQTAEQLNALAAGVTEDVRGMLEAAAMMAEDPVLIDDVRAQIDAGSAADRAVFKAFDAFRDALAALGGAFGERGADVADVGERVLANLRGLAPPALPVSDTPYVLVARDLAPADTALLDPDRVLGIITRDGGPTSHTAIIARARSIPAIVGVEDALSLPEGTLVIVDASSGTITVDPSPAAIAAVRGPRERAGVRASAPASPGALAEGTPIALLANLGSVDEAHEALAAGAEGVGLFRTEFLFGDAPVAPSAAEQAEQYTELLRRFPGRQVTVRVFDAGSDKPLRFLTGAAEPNPVLGRRGLRALRTGAGEQLLTDQLSALARAQEATEARLQVMAPMVSDSAEAAWFVEQARAHGLTAGVMAEVPAVALTASRVFAVCDFVSIGTNDLTQYTMAADRQLGALAGYQDPWHPAVLRLIGMIGDAGAAAGKPVGVCGEAAADPALAVVLAGLGATSLSMAPAALAAVREALHAVTLEQAQAKAAAALSFGTAAQARAAAAEA